MDQIDGGFELPLVLDRVREVLHREGPGIPAVVELRGRQSLVARRAAEIADALGRPLLRLASHELLAEPAARARSLARLLDEAVDAGGVVLVDGADGFAGDDEWLAERLRGAVDEAAGAVVLLSVARQQHRPAIAHEVQLLVDVTD